MYTCTGLDSNDGIRGVLTAVIKPRKYTFETSKIKGINSFSCFTYQESGKVNCHRSYGLGEGIKVETIKYHEVPLGDIVPLVIDSFDTEVPKSKDNEYQPRKAKDGGNRMARKSFIQILFCSDFIRTFYRKKQRWAKRGPAFHDLATTVLMQIQCKNKEMTFKKKLESVFT